MAKVAVIGAGVMGLACAYENLKQGHEVDLYEADDRVGGMAAHFDFDGLSIERYYHFICKPDEFLFDLLKELDIHHLLQWRDTHMGYYYDGQLHDWGNPFALLRFPGLSMAAKLRYGVHMFLSTKLKNWEHLDKQEASVWIRRWIGGDAYNILWKRLFDLKFFKYRDNLSAAWIWARIRRVGQSRKSMLQEQMGYLEGGSDALLQVLESRIKQLGGKIHLQTPVGKVNIEKNKAVSINLKHGIEDYDAVFSTIPLPFVPAMIPDMPKAYLEAYQSIDNMGVVCVLFKLKRPLTRNFWLNISDERFEIPGLIEYSNLRQLPDNIVYVPYYMPRDLEKYQNDNDYFIKEATDYLKLIDPELSDDDIQAVHASRYGYAQPICPPGFKDCLPPVKTSVEGLFVADTSYYYPEDRSISESINVGIQMAKQYQQEMS